MGKYGDNARLNLLSSKAMEEIKLLGYKIVTPIVA